ncbi:uncharacterized protein T551_00317 [Pneumocystis jirovecii RU7]|uniref:Secreted protein n=1 Tax=Pneumocystis jirovecii (strain RU7) TaxID=1408657 RepID=A0A0W4ZWU0_PNEJ7|nr:uncharacterized protein T551_00317 [Pneumocystis jirovecii RU7]KTW32832.1 hypothetical protein T551_00317 [Pneumocystis jirovecii RU7]
MRLIWYLFLLRIIIYRINSSRCNNFLLTKRIFYYENRILFCGKIIFLFHSFQILREKDSLENNRNIMLLNTMKKLYNNLKTYFYFIRI